MIPASVQHSPLQPPRLDYRTDGQVVVTRWGHIGSLVLRPGDRLLPGPADGPVVLLRARGLGRPMLAVRDGRRLLALPGLVPVSMERWVVDMGIDGVEREQERGGPGTDGHYLASVDATGTGGQVSASPLSATAIEGECMKAAIASRRGRGRALAIAPRPEAAQRLLSGAVAGTIRISLLGAVPSQAAGVVIVGPWSARPAPESPQVPLPLQADTRRSA